MIISEMNSADEASQDADATQAKTEMEMKEPDLSEVNLKTAECSDVSNISQKLDNDEETIKKEVPLLNTSNTKKIATPLMVQHYEEAIAAVAHQIETESLDGSRDDAVVEGDMQQDEADCDQPADTGKKETPAQHKKISNESTVMKKKNGMPKPFAQENLHPKKLEFSEKSGEKEEGRKKKAQGCVGEKVVEVAQPAGLLAVVGESETKEDPVLRLLELQHQRAQTGTWVQCTCCSKWRFLAQVHDPQQVHPKWQCSMNQDPYFSSCEVEAELPSAQEEQTMVYGGYAAGSLVWVRVAGFPWWPAMVDDDPDFNTFYWLSDISDLPTHYNVVFFDSEPVSRAWVAVDSIRPFTAHDEMDKLNKTCKAGKDFSKRLAKGKRDATAAVSMTVERRLQEFSFVARFQGKIGEGYKKSSKKQGGKRGGSKLGQAVESQTSASSSVSDSAKAASTSSEGSQVSSLSSTEAACESGSDKVADLKLLLDSTCSDTEDESDDSWTANSSSESGKKRKNSQKIKTSASKKLKTTTDELGPNEKPEIKTKKSTKKKMSSGKECKPTKSEQQDKRGICHPKKSKSSSETIKSKTPQVKIESGKKGFLKKTDCDSQNSSATKTPSTNDSAKQSIKKSTKFQAPTNLEKDTIKTDASGKSSNNISSPEVTKDSVVPMDASNNEILVPTFAAKKPRSLKLPKKSTDAKAEATFENATVVATTNSDGLITSVTPEKTAVKQQSQEKSVDVNSSAADGLKCKKRKMFAVPKLVSTEAAQCSVAQEGHAIKSGEGDQLSSAELGQEEPSSVAVSEAAATPVGPDVAALPSNTEALTVGASKSTSPSLLQGLACNLLIGETPALLDNDPDVNLDDGILQLAQGVTAADRSSSPLFDMEY